MKNIIFKLIFGVILSVTAVLLISTPAYTLIKGAIVGAGGSIELAIAVAWTLIGVTLVSGMVLIKRNVILITPSMRS